MATPWYLIDNISEIDSPALVIYADRVKENIKTLVSSIDNINRLRPHIKTHKSAEVTEMMLAAGIHKFKCATIAEAEMLADAGAPDVLLAYQPVGPKANRLLSLVQKFGTTKFSCLIDNIESAQHLSEVFQKGGKTIDVFIDINMGMNRTGIVPTHVLTLVEACKKLSGISTQGLHAYDGHLRDSDFNKRKAQCDDAFAPVLSLQKEIQEKFNIHLTIVAGGTPTYSIHSTRTEVECSPGTYIYWDKGYEEILKEQHYLHAALVITRVISKPADDIICVDLGHKAIASENPLDKRVFFLNAPELQPIGHSEEHMIFKAESNTYKVGDVFYGVPYHVCPTIALHDRAQVVEGSKVTTSWSTLSRNRKITV